MAVKFPKRTKKTPKKMRYVGFEIECIANQSWGDAEDSDYDDRYESEYDLKVLGKAKKFVLNIHDDGSVEGEGYPAEVVTQPLLDNRVRAIKSLCTTIKKRGGYVNKSCGGHIHIDAKDIKDFMKKSDNVVLATKLITLCEPALYSVTGRNRLNNSYCNPISLRDECHFNIPEEKIWDTDELFGDRYWSVNFSALEDHGTLEFRLFAGTLEHEKWAARAAFAESIVNKLHECLKDPKLLDKLHKQSPLAGLDLEDVISHDFNKSKLYNDLIKKHGAKLIESTGKMVGLHSRYRKVLMKQHHDIWGAYAKADAA